MKGLQDILMKMYGLNLDLKHSRYTHFHTQSQIKTMKHIQSSPDLFLVNGQRLETLQVTLIGISRMWEILKLELRVEACLIMIP